MIHTIQNNFLTVQVKNAGAELCSIKDKAGTEYLFDANPAYWGRSAPVLFPFVGSLKNKSFVYEGKSYQMGQHGFAQGLFSAAKRRSFHLVSAHIERGNACHISLLLRAGYRLSAGRQFHPCAMEGAQSFR